MGTTSKCAFYPGPSTPMISPEALRHLIQERESNDDCSDERGALDTQKHWLRQDTAQHRRPNATVNKRCYTETNCSIMKGVLAQPNPSGN